MLTLPIYQVNNGIEFGMLQAIGEGISLLLRGNRFNLDLAKIFKNWSNRSVIRGWLIELMEKGLREQNFDKIESYIEDTGEVNWLVQDVINKEIPIPVISNQ
jgi:6-phosphogluconate dehydrogenase